MITSEKQYNWKSTATYHSQLIHCNQFINHAFSAVCHFRFLLHLPIFPRDYARLGRDPQRLPKQNICGLLKQALSRARCLPVGQPNQLVKTYKFHCTVTKFTHTANSMMYIAPIVSNYPGFRFEDLRFSMPVSPNNHLPHFQSSYHAHDIYTCLIFYFVCYIITELTVALHVLEYGLSLLPPHHLLLQQHPRWFDILIPAYTGCPRNWPLKRVLLLTLCFILILLGLAL